MTCIDEYWLCDRCGSPLDKSTGEWRWTGSAWEHAHGATYVWATATSMGPIYEDNSLGDVIDARADGSIVLDDGITTHSYSRACGWLAARLIEARAEIATLRTQSALDRVGGAELARRVREQNGG